MDPVITNSDPGLATFWVIGVGIGGLGNGVLVILGTACLATFRSMESRNPGRSQGLWDQPRYLQLHVLFILTYNMFLQARNMHTLIEAIRSNYLDHIGIVYFFRDWSNVLLVLTVVLTDGLLVSILPFFSWDVITIS